MSALRQRRRVATVIGHGDLRAIGLSDLQERLYRLLITLSGGNLTELARHAAIPVDEVAAALDELQAMGFVNRSAGRERHYRPTPPMLAAEILARQREQELHRARAEAAALQQVFESSVGAEGFLNMVEVVSGRDAVVQRVRQLQTAADQEIQVLDRPPYASADRKVTESEVEHLRRGVRARVIYDVVAIELPGQPQALHRLADEGEEARVLKDVPLKLMIADGRSAIVPLAMNEPGIDGIVVMKAEPLVVAMQTLFEHLWRLARPLGSSVDRRTLVPNEQQLLELLSAGLTDRAIGHQLGVSARTVQRRVRRLLDVTGARTRTQLVLERIRRR